MTTSNFKDARGLARSSGPSYQSVIASDRVAAPSVLREVAYEWVDNDEIDIARYVSQTYHELEATRLWPKIWQMACRLEHIPKVGDFYVYEVCDVSLIIVRSSDHEVRAFFNSCLHRGTALAEGTGNKQLFKCPFHGFSWGLDGQFKGMPAQWDFPHIDRDEFCLPEAKVALWGGFVMVNPDSSASDFEDYATPLSAHFAPYPQENRYLAHHACQVVNANWKATQEAFMEGYHVSTTHPHTLRFANDLDCAYDILGTNVSRLLQAVGIPANHLIDEVSQVEVASTMQKMLPKAHRQTVPEDVDARAWLGDRFRESLSKQWRCDLANASDAEMLDSIQYFLFPNFSPWGGYAIPITYRFRPWQNNPNQSLMEIMRLHPIPDDGKFETAQTHWLEPGESWANAPGFEQLGIVIDQDMANLPLVQKGLRAAKQKTLNLSDYQEVRLRHFHQRLDQMLAD
jgi:phenylpropionate dioxygenase-like ring-hydroxylating dioxygenase large terminal subunit